MSSICRTRLCGDYRGTVSANMDRMGIRHAFGHSADVTQYVLDANAYK